MTAISIAGISYRFCEATSGNKRNHSRTCKKLRKNKGKTHTKEKIKLQG